METIERLEAEFEAVKLVLLVMCRHLDRFQWRAVRDVANAAARKDADRRLATPMTDQQIEHLQLVVDVLTGEAMPDWQPPAPPPARRAPRARKNP